MHEPKIFVYDEFNPEDCAMMQALYSRSSQSVVEHVEKVKETGSGKFMEKYYVGYGHLSIADCGSTTAFIEGVSMLVAKAVQDWPLYAGQESSTRYIDYEKQPIVDPVGTDESHRILRGWMDFYLNNQEKLREFLKEKYPQKESEKDAMYEKAIAARSFDILRGFLPAGTTTQLSWHTNLRQAWDKLALLRHNPLKEVRDVAAEIHEKFKEKYANSFSHKLYEKTEEYRGYIGDKYTFFDPENFPREFTYSTNIDPEELKEYMDVIEKRPPKTNLPHFLSDLGHMRFRFLMDFGSFRDIQRHRNGVCRMPLLSTKHGFHQWYINQLPADMATEARALIASQEQAINQLDTNDISKQYYVAMGYNVPTQIMYALPPTVYVTELRSGKMVHPTLREVAFKMHDAIMESFPFMTMYSDLDPDDWDVRRGSQDITNKEENEG